MNDFILFSDSKPNCFELILQMFLNSLEKKQEINMVYFYHKKYLMTQLMNIFMIYFIQ